MPSVSGVTHDAYHGCSCCSEGLKAAYEAVRQAGLSRRHLLLGAGTAAIGSWAVGARSAQAQAGETATTPAFVPADELVVQPVLTYTIPKPREQASWRGWGGIQTEEHVNEEIQRINDELKQLVADSQLAIKLLPVAKVASREQAANVAKSNCDVMLIYAATGPREFLVTLTRKDRPTLFFLRHRSGPISLHYEVLHPRYLRKNSDHYDQDLGVDVHDVVVDEYDDLAWRLRALLALRKTLGTRIVALGGTLGWGDGRKFAPPIARDTWHLDIREVTYDDLAKRIASARKDEKAIAEAHRQAAVYLAEPGVSLHADRKFVENAFILNDIFKDYMREHDARAFTIGGCMTTVIPITETTACVPLSLLNDEGYLAFCESDFVVIPSGILMSHITGTPPFLNDPTWPHHGVVTLAHCTAPRRMDGKKTEPVEIHTHFESDYGAAPKVEMTRGQVLTNVIPDFECRKWVGVRGRVEANPFHDICRSQIDVALDGDWNQLLEDMRGFHWMTVYGDCLREVGYAIKHVGIGWQNVSA